MDLCAKQKQSWESVSFTSEILSPIVSVCKQMLALPPYGKLTASSEKSYKKGSSCLADDGHIMTNKAWCAKENNGKFHSSLIVVSRRYWTVLAVLKIS